MVASLSVEEFCWGGGAGAMRGLEGAGFDVAWGAIGWDCSMLQVVAFCVWWLGLVAMTTPVAVRLRSRILKLFVWSGQLGVQN